MGDMSRDGRAQTDAERSDVTQRILCAWMLVPHLRLGQFIDLARRSRVLFSLDDNDLAERCERYAAAVAS